jgi:hypothetical protein
MKSLVGAIADAISKRKRGKAETIEQVNELDEVEGWVEPEKPKSKRRKWLYIVLVIVLAQIAFFTFQVLRWYYII